LCFSSHCKNQPKAAQQAGSLLLLRALSLLPVARPEAIVIAALSRTHEGGNPQLLLLRPCPSCTALAPAFGAFLKPVRA
jgi:hypothetical protein